MTGPDDLTAIRARVWEVCARTGTTDEQLAEVIGADPGRIAASFACERRFSTYELAAIAEHGGTTVEWLCGEDPEYDPAPPETAAGLTRLRDRPDPFTTWSELRPRIVTSEQRVSEARAEMEQEIHEPTRSTRWFWWNARTLTNPWRPLFWGSDEHCNRTIGLRLPGGVLFLCLNVPLRQEECGECRAVQS